MGIFDKISKKKADFKAKQNNKFKNQSYTSFKQTEADAAVYRKAVNTVETLSSQKTFCYVFKNPAYEKKMRIAKKINFWSLVAFTAAAIVCCILFGCMKLAIHVSDAPFWNKEHTEFNQAAFDSANLSSWLVNFIPQITAMCCMIIYLCFYIPYLNKKSKKFSDDPNFVHTFDLNIVFFIIFVCVFISLLLSFAPVNLLPITILNMVSYNTTVGLKLLVILTGIFDILFMLASLTYIGSTISCLIFNPKFDKTKLNL